MIVARPRFLRAGKEEERIPEQQDAGGDPDAEHARLYHFRGYAALLGSPIVDFPSWDC